MNCNLDEWRRLDGRMLNITMRYIDERNPAVLPQNRRAPDSLDAVLAFDLYKPPENRQAD